MTMTQEDLHNYFIYTPETGIFVKKQTNTVVGCIKIDRRKNKVDYPRVLVSYKGKQYKAHRLAFLYMTGTLPRFVDHIDGNSLNNKWNNLRAASNSQNSVNSKIRSTNKSGYKGVFFQKELKTNPWLAGIKVNCKRIHLGCFSTKNEAALAYNKAALIYFGEFAKLNEIK